MCKKIILLALCVSLSIAASAQFVFGIKAGYSSSLGFDNQWQFDSDKLSIKSDLSEGMHIGLMLRTGNTFIFQPELLYNYQTSTISITKDISTLREVKLKTIDVPMLLGFSLGSSKNFNFRILFGPKFRFNVGSSNIASEDDDLIISPRNWQLGFDTGIGLDIWRFSLDARYNLIPNLYQYKNVNDIKLNTTPINSFTISLGLKLVDIGR